MRALIALLIAMSAGGTVGAQDVNTADVPSIVANTFKTQFPNATDVEWELEGEIYKADFEIGKADHDIWIDKSGKVTRHEQDIQKSDLPAAIAQHLTTSFKDYSVDDITKTEADGATQYEVELDGRNSDRKVTLSADGKVISDVED